MDFIVTRMLRILSYFAGSRRQVLTALMLVTFCVFFDLPAQASYSDGVIAYRSNDYTRAYKEWISLAEQGHPRAAYGIGLLHLLGHGIEKDTDQARYWLDRAAARGSAEAQYALGRLYYSEPKDSLERRKGVDLIAQAARMGYARAQHAMGEMYLRGETLAANELTALRYFTMAANQGHEPSRPLKNQLETKLSSNRLNLEPDTADRQNDRSSEGVGRCDAMLFALIKKKNNLTTKTKLLNRCLQSADPANGCRAYFTKTQEAFVDHEIESNAYLSRCPR